VQQPDQNTPAALRDLAALFLRLGFTAFGGPAAHIALMENEIVRRRQWLTHEEFLDLLGATNLIPGPNSTEMAIHVGRARAGTAGLIVAGTCFIVPAMLIVLACAWAYVKFGRVPQVQSVLYGVKPVIIAVVAQALWNLTRSAVKTKSLAVVALLATAAAFLGVNELLVLFAAGIFVPVARGVFKPKKSLPLIAWPMLATVSAGGAASFSLVALFLFFLKVGAVLFGSGYVLLAFLRADLVDRWRWLTEAQLLDAVAVGQVTPGPVFTTATFIGYVLGGFPGAMLATVGIFLPAFVFVALSAPWIPRLRKSPVASGFLDGVNVASLALMVVVTWFLARSAIVDAWTIALAAISGVLLLRFRVNSTWLVAGGAIVGWLLSFRR
jgi:chromate transporter